MKTITFGRSAISRTGSCYVIAEIGHNHQGNLDTALKMIEVAAGCGANAVKFQKRNNRALFTRSFYNRPYENENSYGRTYGEHREHLEFSRDEYLELKRCADEKGVEFIATAFDFESVDFLEDIDVSSYKVASGDLTNTPLLERIAHLGKPMFISTGAASMEETRIAYETVRALNDKVCLLHCIAAYPADYEYLNLRVISRFLEEFPDAVIGYSGHDNGILAAVIAYMLGATVIEKHFTLNRAWKGTDHKFSLEPEGLRKQVRDLRRVQIALGDGVKRAYDFELEARKKMGKGIYAARDLPAGTELTLRDICFKTPANDTPVYLIASMLGKRTKMPLGEEQPLSPDMVE